MSNDSRPNLPPFLSPYRASGLLLHVTSLPSPYGIGDVGPAAIAWIDQRYRRRSHVANTVGRRQRRNVQKQARGAVSRWKWRKIRMAIAAH